MNGTWRQCVVKADGHHILAWREDLPGVGVRYIFRGVARTADDVSATPIPYMVIESEEIERACAALSVDPATIDPADVAEIVGTYFAFRWTVIDYAVAALAAGASTISAASLPLVLSDEQAAKLAEVS